MILRVKEVEYNQKLYQIVAVDINKNTMILIKLIKIKEL